MQQVPCTEQTEAFNTAITAVRRHSTELQLRCDLVARRLPQCPALLLLLSSILAYPSLRPVHPAAGTEPDFVLVSCAGRSRPGMDPADLRKVVEAKRRGEENLRLSGLGYTIIRPGG